MDLELNAGIFVISGFYLTKKKTERSAYNVYRKDIALKAGTVFGASSIEITAPSLGQWQLFIAKRDVEKGEWVVTNDYIFAEQLIATWNKESSHTTELIKLDPGNFVKINKNDNGIWDIEITSKKNTLISTTTVTDLFEAISNV